MRRSLNLTAGGAADVAPTRQPGGAMQAHNDIAFILVKWEI
jgi:hypothetical protein